MWSTAKISGPFILFVVSFISGVTPTLTLKCLDAKIGVSSKLKRIIGVLNCFSGGIFFATSILDLLPESRESLEYVFKNRNIHLDFPLSECILAIGFLFIMFIEHLAHLCHTNFVTRKTSDRRNPNSVKSIKHFIENTDVDNRRKAGFENVNFVNEIAKSLQKASKTQESTGTSADIAKSLGNASHAAISNDTSADTNNDEIAETSIDAQNETCIVSKTKHLEDVPADSPESTERKPTPIRNFVLVIALSVHMIFDGLAVGVLDKQSQIWQLLLALSIHKTLVFVTIGIQLHQIFKSSIKTIVVVLLLSLVSPLGVLLGEVISTTGSDVEQKIVSSVLLSFAAGNFLFITFFEILQRELGGHGHDIIKVLTVVIGFSIFAVFKFFIHEGE